MPGSAGARVDTAHQFSNLILVSVRTLPSFRFRYCPPYPWRGPQPEVDAFRASEMTTIAMGSRTVALDAGEWLLQTRDGGLETMSHDTFRRWYDPVDDEAAAALRGERPARRPPRRAPRRRPRASQRQAVLGL
jgi:hypothetical protein